MNQYVTAVRAAGHIILFIGLSASVLVSLFNISAYGAAVAGDPPGLTPTEISTINALPDGGMEMPAWVIVQLLDASDRLHRFVAGRSVTTVPAAGNNRDTLKISGIPSVTINSVLADTVGYRGRLCAIHAIFGSAENVDTDLELDQQDHCWAVILLDRRYLTPLQVFTTNRPGRFKKDSPVVAIGYFLATRTDRPRAGNLSQALTIPVFMGTVVSAAPRMGGSSGFPNWVFFAVLVLLTGAYLLIRIYIARSGGKRPLQRFLNS